VLTTIVETNPGASDTVQALVFTGPAKDASSTRVAMVPAPRPGPGQVAIDVAYAGINFKDVMVRRGDPGYAPGWPFIAGLEVAGRVRALGPGVGGFEVGDEVAAYTGSGGLSEVAIADARAVVRVPEGVALVSAAVAAGVLVTAQLLLHDFGRVRDTDRILVHGAAGGVGAAVAQIARAAGVVALVGTVGDASRIDAARALGYDVVLVRHEIDPAALLLQSEGVDLILDPQGTSLLELDLALLRPGGRIVLFGNASGGALDALPPVSRLLGRNAAIGGFSLASIAAADPRAIAAALTRTLESIAAGTVHIEVDVLQGLGEVAAAHQALAAGRGAGKYVVRLLRQRIGAQRHAQ
jgi:NADPH2:quinone reductase